jgi:uncharacterized protein YceK
VRYMTMCACCAALFIVLLTRCAEVVQRTSSTKTATGREAGFQRHISCC